MNTREHVKRGNGIYLAIIVTYIIINIGIDLIVSVFHLSFTYVQLILIAQIGYALPAIWYVFRKRQPLRDSIHLRKVNFLTILLLILFAFSIMPLMTLLNVLSLLISENHIQSTVTGMLDQTSFFICLFVIGILPAVLEEFVYRGVIYQEQRKGSIGKAILCSGLFFGLLHMNINQFSYAFVMGIILAVTVEATGSILGSMIVHATINGYSVTITKLQPYLMEKLEKVQGEAATISAELSRKDILAMLPSYIIMAVFATAFAAFLMFLIVKYNHREEAIRQIFAGRRNMDGTKQCIPFADLYFVLAVSIAVALMIRMEIGS